MIRQAESSMGSPLPFERGGLAGLSGQRVGQGILQALWRRRGIVIAAALLAASGGMLFIAQATSVYRSTSKLYVQSSGPDIIGDQGIPKPSANYLQTQCELLKSTPILAAALESPGLADKAFGKGPGGVATLKRQLDVSVGRKDDIITVALEGPDAGQTSIIVNAVVDAYVSYQQRQNRSTVDEVRRILVTEKVRRDQELDAKLAEMLEYKRANPEVSFQTDKGNVHMAQLARLSDAIVAAELEALDSQARYQAAKKLLDEPLLMRQFVDSRLASQGYSPQGALRSNIQEELRRASETLELVSASCTSEAPAYKDAQALVRRLGAQLEEMDHAIVKAHVAQTLQHLDVSRRKCQQLQQAFSDQQAVAQRLNVQQAQLAVLESELRRLERLCDILDNRIRELDLTQDAGAMNISILEVARPGAEPVKPVKGRIMGISLLGGLLAGSLLALMRDRMDKRIADAAEISSVVPAPLLGVIPHFSSPNDTPATRGRIIEREPLGEPAEAYRTVRTSIHFGLPSQAARTILVTSPDSSDGKTTLASNLAISMAQAGQKVLLIDGDLRRPRLHEIFGLQGRYGLTSVLSGQTPVAQALLSTDVPMLDLLGCGPQVPNPAEALNCDAFRQMLASLSDQYDRIIIDSPPTLPVADARILAATCDACLLVARLGKTPRQSLQEAWTELSAVGARVLGVIVNDSRKRGSYGYAYRKTSPVADSGKTTRHGVKALAGARQECNRHENI